VAFCVAVTMAESDSAKVLSYAKVVNPNAESVKEESVPIIKPEVKPEVKDENTAPADDGGEEGFQEVISKKSEKVRPARKKKPRRPRNRDRERESAPRDSVARESGGDASKESKESTPVEKTEEPDIEYVPAPPPKTNPWYKKASIVESTADNVKNLAEDIKSPEIKVSNSPSKPRNVKKASDLVKKEGILTPSNSSNPWKKKSEASDEAKDSNKQEESNTKISKPGDTWPALDKDGISPRKKTPPVKNSDCSETTFESGATSSLDLNEEGKENKDTLNIMPQRQSDNAKKKKRKREKKEWKKPSEELIKIKSSKPKRLTGGLREGKGTEEERRNRNRNRGGARNRQGAGRSRSKKK